MGVSQGAIIALDAVASGRWQVGALVTFAGLLPSIPVAPISVKTDVLLIHGGADPTIPAEETRRAEKRLSVAGFKVESHILPGVGHTVTAEGLDLAKRFLAASFAEQ